MIKPSAIAIGVGAECGLGAALCRRFDQGLSRSGRRADRGQDQKSAETIISAAGSAEPIVTDATLEQQMFGTKFPD